LVVNLSNRMPLSYRVVRRALSGNALVRSNARDETGA